MVNSGVNHHTVATLSGCQLCKPVALYLRWTHQTPPCWSARRWLGRRNRSGCVSVKGGPNEVRRTAMRAARRLARRASCLLSAAALCGCAYGGGYAGAQNGEAASCVGPILTTAAQVRPTTALPPVAVSPGQELWIYGYWYETCHDTNHQPPSRPFRHLAILVIQGPSRDPLATVNARQPGGTFDVTVRLPASMHPGAATIRSSLAIEVPLRLMVRAK